MVLRLRTDAQESFDHLDLFIQGPEGMFFGKPRIELSDDKLNAIIDAPINDGWRATYASQLLTIILVDGTRAIERTLVPNVD